MIISTFFGEVLLRPSLLIVVLVLKLLPNDVLHLLLATELFRGSTRCLPTPSPYILTAKHSLFWEQNIFEDKNTPKHPKHDEEDDEDAGSDGEDVSIPEGTARLMRRCFNPVTGVGK